MTRMSGIKAYMSVVSNLLTTGMLKCTIDLKDISRLPVCTTVGNDRGNKFGLGWSSSWDQGIASALAGIYTMLYR